MAYLPDVCLEHMQYELLSDKGKIKHAALTLYSYYCKLRNKNTGLCFPSLNTTVTQTGITPKSNLIQNRAFLFEVAWIHIYSTGLIRPLKGFYPDDQIWLLRVWRLFLRPDFVLFIRMPVLHNRTLVLLIRTLFKGILNQPNQPAQLTREGAESAPPAQPDEKSNVSPAGKPAPHSTENAAPAGTPADVTIKHPAVQMVKEITGRFPKKDTWNRISREIGSQPKLDFFRRSFEIWRGFGGSETNLNEWLFIPNKTGKPPQRFERNGNGNGSGKLLDVPKNEPLDAEKPLNEKQRLEALEVLRDLSELGGDISEWQQIYTPEDWVWLIENIEKRL